MISVGTPPTITSAASLRFRASAYGAARITTSGSPTPKLVESGGLPPGMSFRATSGTATISGTPAGVTPGTYDVVITATNGVGVVSQHLTVTVYLPGPGYWLATASGQVYGLGAAGSFGGCLPRGVPGRS